MRYVVYLTTYTGELLPKYYIGSTNELRAISGKYFGSVSSKQWKTIFRKELSEHPELFSLEALLEEMETANREKCVEKSRLFQLRNCINVS